MKLKELCERTGLSRKTVRLYEEKALFTPKKELRNGREYRDYSEEDVRTLLVVASLRRAWFTMEEIRQMQQDPAAIGEILPRYQEWLRLQKHQLDGLLAAAEKLDLAEIGDVETLSAKFEQETRKLPLPAVDVKPHFKYLEELEEPPVRVNIQDTEILFDNKRLLWPWVYKTKSQKLLDDTKAAIRADADGPVKDREPEKEPLWLRILQVPLTIVAFASLFVASMYAWVLYFHWKAWLVFAISGGALGLISYRRYCRERQAWIDRMNANREKEGISDETQGTV